MSHYIEKCEKTKDWFARLGRNKKEILERNWSNKLDKEKGIVLRKLEK